MVHIVRSSGPAILTWSFVGLNPKSVVYESGGTSAQISGLGGGFIVASEGTENKQKQATPLYQRH